MEDPPYTLLLFIPHLPVSTPNLPSPPQLHHQRRICRHRHSSRRKVHHRKPPQLLCLHHQIIRRRNLLRRNPPPQKTQTTEEQNPHSHCSHCCRSSKTPKRRTQYCIAGSLILIWSRSPTRRSKSTGARSPTSLSTILVPLQAESPPPAASICRTIAAIVEKTKRKLNSKALGRPKP